MNRFVQKALLGSLLFFLFCFQVFADVKLRLYLKDGSLEAGNLVSETENSFVLLTKNGREEVSKDKIMFVNGKPLVYWQQHPERNYQTEIIPSEIPNPAYVNDKAALPVVPLPVATPVPKLSSVLPRPEAAAKPTPTPSLKPVATATPMPTPQATPLVTPQPAARATPVPTVAPVTTSVPPVTTSSVVAAKQVARVPKARRVRSSAVKPAPVAIHVPEPTESRPSAFSRDGMAAYFADRANRYLEEGKRGRAIQDFHMAVLLNRRDADSYLKLGRLYAEDGNRKWAEKYLSSPGLKKNLEVKSILEGIERNEKKTELSRNLLFGGTGAGLLALAPVLFLLRRLRSRKKDSGRVVTADDLNELVRPAEEEAPTPSSRIKPETEDVALPPVAEAIVEAPPIKAESPIVAAPAPKVSEKPPLLASPEEKILLPAPSLVTPPAPPVTPDKVSTPEPKELPEVPVTPKIVEPVKEPVSVKSDEISDKPSRTMDDLIRSREDFLRASKSVDELVAKGHGHAAVGEIEAARKAYRTALALHPQSIDATLGLAYLCFVQENWELALEHYLHAAQINPKSADVHYGIGRVFLETGHESEAVEEFRQTLSLDPTYYEARETLSALGVPA